MKYLTCFILNYLLLFNTCLYSYPYYFNESLFENIHLTKGYIFTQYRQIKTVFPEYLHKELEQHIKEYEYRYLSNKDEFIDYIFLMYDEYKSRQNLTDVLFRINENDFKEHVYTFLKEFIPLYKQLPRYEKETIDKFILEHNDNVFLKEVIQFGEKYYFMFDTQVNNNNTAEGIRDIIENIPRFLNKERNTVKINNEFDELIINISNVINSNINSEHINNEFMSLDKKVDYLSNEISTLISNSSFNKFSSFLEMYINESINNINGSNTNNVNEMVMEENAIDNYKNEIQSGNKAVQKEILKNINNNINDNNNLNTISNDCNYETKLNELQQIINKNLHEIQQNEIEAQNELKEVPSTYLNNNNTTENSKFKLILNIIKQFIAKVLKLAIQHFPFYFFKICIPAGPLTFGCCPEVSFYPQQLYNVLMSFDKVDQFKLSCKAYPDWLSSIGHDEDFSETRYYICAQSYLTIQLSSIWNMCNVISLNYLLILNFFGLIPGDLPLCFWACLQGMAACKTSLNNFGACDNMVNLSTIIMAAFIPSLRLRLIMMFGLCTYIPFLIRWDLVPKWKESNYGKEGEDALYNKRFTKGRNVSVKTIKENERKKECVNCVIEEKGKVMNNNESVFEKEYVKLNGGDDKEIMKMKNEIKVYKDIVIDNEEIIHREGNEVHGVYLFNNNTEIREKDDDLYFLNKMNNIPNYKYIFEERNINNKHNYKYLLRRKYTNKNLRNINIDLTKYNTNKHQTHMNNNTMSIISQAKQFPFQIESISLNPNKISQNKFHYEMLNTLNQRIE